MASVSTPPLSMSQAPFQRASKDQRCRSKHKAKTKEHCYLYCKLLAIDSKQHISAQHGQRASKCGYLDLFEHFCEHPKPANTSIHAFNTATYTLLAASKGLHIVVVLCRRPARGRTPKKTYVVVLGGVFTRACTGPRNEACLH